MENNVPVNTLSTSEINNFLTRRLGEKEAGEIMEYIHLEISKNVAAKVDDTKAEMALWRDNMHKEFATRQDAEDLKTKLVKRVSKAESTLILWGLVFWITTLIALYCFLKFF